MKLQTIVSRGIDPGATAVVTVGTLHAGTKENIIPDTAVLSLSVRTFEPTVRDRVLAGIERIAVGEAASYGAPKPPDLDTIYSFPVTANDPTATDIVADRIRRPFRHPSDRCKPPCPPAARTSACSVDAADSHRSSGSSAAPTPLCGTRPSAAGRVEEDIAFNHSPDFAPVQHPTLEAGIEADDHGRPLLARPTHCPMGARPDPMSEAPRCLAQGGIRNRVTRSRTTPEKSASWWYNSVRRCWPPAISWTRSHRR